MIGVFVDCFRQHFRSNFKCRKRFIVKMKVEGLTLCNIGYKYIFRPIIYYLVNVSNIPTHCCVATFRLNKNVYRRLFSRLAPSRSF